MKIRIVSLFTLATLMIPFSVSAMTYDTLDDFLTAEWKVCSVGADGINVFMLKNGNVPIIADAYTLNPEYSCTEYKLSEDDRDFYNSVRSMLGSSYTQRVDKAIMKYYDTINMSDLSEEEKLQKHEQIIKRVETMIFNLVSKYPEDSVPPVAIRDKYMKLQLIMFELMILDM